MPTYEYACAQCGNRFDVFQRIRDEPLRICDVCGGDLRRVFHPAGIVFKGSGFYKTDSRQATSGKKSGEGSEQKASEPKSSESKSSESKSSESKGEKGTAGKPDKKEAS